MSRYSEFSAGLLLILAWLVTSTVTASQTGIPGYSKNATGPNSCHACHTAPTSAPANSLIITGSNTALVGSTNSYTIKLIAPYGQIASFGGFDLSTSNGTLISADAETSIINSELVHSNRKATVDTGSSYEVQWNFNWRAPATAGSTTLYACGLPVNGDGRAAPQMMHHGGSTDGFTVCTTFTIQVLQAPIALAGNNQTVIETSVVTLDGSGSNDPDGSITSYSWVQTSGTPVILFNATTSIATFMALNVLANTTEELIFQLTVTDNDGLSNTDTVSVFVQDILVSNSPPFANAGIDQIVNENSTVNLDASASTDDGFIASYLWEQTAGVNSVTLNNATTVAPNFTAPAVDAAGDVLTFQLTVTDNLGVSSTDTVNITVNDVDTPPTAKITDASGIVISAISNNGLVTLYGNFSSDPDGPITAFSWNQTAGSAIINPGPSNENSFTFTAPNDPGNSINICLTVTGDKGITQNTITATLTLANLPPVVDPGVDQTVTEGSVINLQGTVTDPNNNLASVQWRQINCGTNCIMPATNINLPLIANDASSQLVAPAIAPENSGLLLDFELLAKDADGLSAVATTQITIVDNGISGFPSGVTTFTSFNNQPMGISIESLDPTISAVITGLLPEDDASVTDKLNRPSAFPYALTNLEINLSAPGSVLVTLYFPEPVPDNVDFYQYLSSYGWVNTSKAKDFSDLTYSSANGWAEITQEVEFSADRTRVAILLSDGGPSDDDGLVNGVIHSKGGPGVNPEVSTSQSGSGALHPLSLLLTGLLLLPVWRRR